MTRLLTSIVVCWRLAAPVFGQMAEGRATFYEPPQLFVMTGFIANTTGGRWGNGFITSGEWTLKKQQAALEAWRKGLGSDYDAEKVVTGFREAGATGVIFYDKWHDGLVCHATKLTSFRTERDLVGPTIAALRKHNLKIVVYYSVGIDFNPDPRFRDWVCRDSRGEPIGAPFPGDWMSFHSPYRQYVMDQLVEILKMYGRIDGFWLDVLNQPNVSYDKYSRAAFQKKFGKALEQATPDDLTDFDIFTRRSLLQDIRKALVAVQPDINLTFNGAGMSDIEAPKTAVDVEGLVDYFSMEGHRLDRIDRGARTGHNMNRPFEVGMLLNSSWYTPMDNQAPPPAMTDEEAIVSAATAWTQGANIYAAMAPGHSGVFDPRGDMRGLRAIGRWLSGQKPSLEDSLPYADAAIVRGHPSASLRHLPTLGSLWANYYRRETPPKLRPGEAMDLALRKSGYFTELTGTAFPRRPVDWKSYRLLVLPENAALDEATVSEIRNYVSAGGNLIAAGHASLFDESARRRADFALKDVFGVQYDGDMPGYKQFSPLADSGIASRMILSAPALRVKAAGGRVLAVWKSAGDVPAVVENRYGKGRCLYVSAGEIPTSESGLLGELANRLIGEPVVQVKSSRQYSLVLNRKAGKFLLYLMNRDTGSRTARESGMAPDTTFQPGEERIQSTIRPPVLGGAGRVDLLPAGTPVKISRSRESITVYVNASPSVTALRLSGD